MYAWGYISARWARAERGATTAGSAYIVEQETAQSIARGEDKDGHGM